MFSNISAPLAMLIESDALITWQSMVTDSAHTVQFSAVVHTSTKSNSVAPTANTLEIIMTSYCIMPVNSVRVGPHYVKT